MISQSFILSHNMELTDGLLITDSRLYWRTTKDVQAIREAKLRA